MKSLREKIQGPGANEVNMFGWLQTLARMVLTMFGSQIIRSIRHSTAIIRDLEPHLQKAAIDSWARALRVVFIFQSVMAFLVILWCLPIQEFALPYVIS